VLLTCETSSESQTIELGRAIGSLLEPGDFVTLDGELGAGKTRLTRGIVAGAGLPTSQVSSPTFCIAQEYTPAGVESSSPAAAPSLPAIIHVDAYRLRGVDELETVGWDELVGARRSLSDRPAVVIEWASRIEPALPPTRLNVRLDHVDSASDLAPAIMHPEDMERAPDPSQTPIHTDARSFILDIPDAWTTRSSWPAVRARLGAFEIGHHNMTTPSSSGSERPASLSAVNWPKCPVTGKPVSPDSPTFPFFDDRARLADLNKWLTGSYVVSREITDKDDDIEPERPA